MIEAQWNNVTCCSCPSLHVRYPDMQTFRSIRQSLQVSSGIKAKLSLYLFKYHIMKICGVVEV